MSIFQWLFGRGKRAEGSDNIGKTHGSDYESDGASSKQVADLIDRLAKGDENSRDEATVQLYHHPEPAAVNALIRALQDESARVRGSAAESLRCIAYSSSCSVDPKPILEALRHEPEDSEAHHYIMGALREIGAGAAAEQVMEERRKAEITAEGGPVAEKLREMEETAGKLWREGKEFETAFENLFSDLQNETADVRTVASKKLAENQNAIRKLISIYQQNSQSDPRKSVLAGRVLGRKIDAGKQDMVHAQTSSIMFGINVAFTPCVCGHCGKLNVGIPVPEGGLYSPFYGQQDDQNCVYSLPVICDNCGKEFFIAWDSDPR